MGPRPQLKSIWVFIFMKSYNRQLGLAISMKKGLLLLLEHSSWVVTVTGWGSNTATTNKYISIAGPSGGEASFKSRLKKYKKNVAKLLQSDDNNYYTQITRPVAKEWVSSWDYLKKLNRLFCDIPGKFQEFVNLKSSAGDCFYYQRNCSCETFTVSLSSRLDVFVVISGVDPSESSRDFVFFFFWRKIFVVQFRKIRYVSQPKTRKDTKVFF